MAVPPRRPRVFAGRRAPGRPGRRAGDGEPFLVRQLYQRHLLQLGYTDRLLGRLIARLEETGLWDEALVVVTADHGVSFRVGQSDRRAVTAENVEDIAPIPLFVKAPGQDRGRVTTGPVQTIDVLPTIADALGVRLPWKVDGRPAEQAQETARRSTCSRATGSRCASTPPPSSAAGAPRSTASCGCSATASTAPTRWSGGR